jgi:predicted nucleic acid-binding protein
MVALLDDHLLRDLLAHNVSADLSEVLDQQDAATTNLYLYRLSRSVVSARGGALTGSWPSQQRRELGRRLLELPESVQVVPVRAIAYRMAEIADAHRVSTLGAEAAAAAEYLSAALYVWEGDDGPGIRTAVTAVGAPYRTVAR